MLSKDLTITEIKAVKEQGAAGIRQGWEKISVSAKDVYDVCDALLQERGRLKKVLKKLTGEQLFKEVKRRLDNPENIVILADDTSDYRSLTPKDLRADKSEGDG